MLLYAAPRRDIALRTCCSNSLSSPLLDPNSASVWTSFASEISPLSPYTFRTRSMSVEPLMFSSENIRAVPSMMQSRCS